MLNDYIQFKEFYIDDLEGTGYLAFRDLPYILQDAKGKNALDFGCGAGRSAKYLKRLGYKVTGIDINLELISIAKKNFPFDRFIHSEHPILPFQDDLFDLVLNSFVLFDMSTKDKIINNLKEMKRVCKKDGKILSIVNSNHLFNKNWATINNKFSQNLNLKSGDVAKIYLSDKSIEIYDYFWTNADYEECFKKAGLHVTNKYEPLGNSDDGYDWEDELRFPPYSIWLCSV